MSSRVPSKLTLPWLLHERRARDILQYGDQHKAAIIVSPEGKIVPGRYSHNSKNVVYDLREVEVSAEPVVIEPPYLTVTEDDPNTELDVSWTLPESYDALYLERSEDGITFSPLATLAGDAASYDDAAVTVGVEEWYRIRGQVGGAYSAYSNIDSGMLVAGCSYSLPSPMASSTAFFKGFANGDFVDGAWTGDWSDSLPAGGSAGGTNHAGNIFLSEDGKKIILSGGSLGTAGVLVLTRQGDNSFTVETLAGTSIEFGYTMSRTGIVAGAAGTDGAVWLSGVTSAPTTDSGIRAWNYITPPGDKLFGYTASNGDAIEREIGGSDTTIKTGGVFGISGVSHCGDVIALMLSNTVIYKKTGGTWAQTGTLAGTAGGAEFPAVVQVTGDGTKAFGNPSSVDDQIYMWDLTGTGTLSATALGQPSGTVQEGYCTGVSSDGAVVVGWFTTGTIPLGFTTKPYYWLASEGYATAHDLEAYFIAQGLANFGSGSGEYLGIDNVTVNANGTAFAVRADRDTGERSFYYVACPAPT